MLIKTVDLNGNVINTEYVGSELRSKAITIKLTEGEKNKLEKLAKQNSMSMSEYIRNKALNA